MKGEGGSWKNEWMVIPSALIAATPVGATTIIRFVDLLRRVFRKVVFPVPALPVRKTLFPVCSINSHAVLKSPFSSIMVFLLVTKVRKIIGLCCGKSTIPGGKPFGLLESRTKKGRSLESSL